MQRICKRFSSDTTVRTASHILGQYWGRIDGIEGVVGNEKGGITVYATKPNLVPKHYRGIDIDYRYLESPFIGASRIVSSGSHKGNGPFKYSNAELNSKDLFKQLPQIHAIGYDSQSDMLTIYAPKNICNLEISKLDNKKCKFVELNDKFVGKTSINGFDNVGNYYCLALDSSLNEHVSNGTIGCHLRCGNILCGVTSGHSIVGPDYLPINFIGKDINDSENWQDLIYTSPLIYSLNPKDNDVRSKWVGFTSKSFVNDEIDIGLICGRNDNKFILEQGPLLVNIYGGRHQQGTGYIIHGNGKCNDIELYFDNVIYNDLMRYSPFGQIVNDEGTPIYPSILNLSSAGIIARFDGNLDDLDGRSGSLVTTTNNIPVGIFVAASDSCCIILRFTEEILTRIGANPLPVVGAH